jgi:hypothetical protein
MRVARRTVVLLCGPPGAGKSTAARESGLMVFDRDDPEWQSERHFRMRIADLARDPHAQAVVIRAGANASARRKAATLIGATHTFVISGEPSDLVRRVIDRGRADAVQSLEWIKLWFSRFDDSDDVRPFPGWDSINVADLGMTSQEW